MEELMAAIEKTTNVESLVYDVSTGIWTVHYNEGLPDDVDTDDLIDFLENA